MKLTQKGKQCLNQFVSKLATLREKAASGDPVNKFLLSQIDALSSIVNGVIGAWDATFELSLINNANDYLKKYNIVNGGDGSWAIALSDNHSRDLAKLTENLFSEFKYNLFEYVDGLPQGAKEISVLGMKLAYSNPKAIIDSAICQIQGAIQFYDYLETENSLLQKRDNANKQIPASFNETPLTDVQIHQLIHMVCQVPASYLRYLENRLKGVARVMPNSFTGALGFYCLLGLNDYLESCALSGKKDLLKKIDGCIQHDNVLDSLVNKLKAFIQFADRFSKEAHADYKKEIIAKLSKVVNEQLKLLATSERLGCFYTSTYSDMYIAGKKLQYYYDKNQTEKFTLQAEVAAAAIKQYLSELKHLVPNVIAKITLRSGALDSKARLQDVIRVIAAIDSDIISTFAVPPAMVVHQLLKEVSRLNLVHVEWVMKNGHTLGETGDKINDLYSFLLTTFTRLTLAEEPVTAIKFKLIDNLSKVMAAELSPVENIQGNNVMAVKVCGGSPLHQAGSVTRDPGKPEEIKIEIGVRPQWH